VPGLARLLGVDEADVRQAIGGPWSQESATPDLGSRVTMFIGLANPRTPSRPLAAIRVDHAEGVVEVGHAVGVPLPTGEAHWVLAAPRTTVSFDVDGLDDVDGVPALVLDALRSGVHAVVEAAVLRGTTW
jgi:hypothetical protein